MLGYLILGLVALTLVIWLATRRPGPEARELTLDCPTCRSAMHPLADVPGEADDDDERRSYEVLACGTCDRAISAVHAVPSAWAYCPACLQRSLQVQCARLPVPSGRPPIVRAEETCHLCGLERTRMLGREEPSEAQQGRVIPFPGARRR